MKNTVIRVMKAALILAALLIAACGNIFEEPAQRGGRRRAGGLPG
jgi:hypothetical protein